MQFIQKNKSLGIALFVFGISLMACKKEDLANTNTLNQMVDTAAVLLYKGNFVNGPYGAVMGSAEVYKQSGKFKVKLSNFNTTNGPDLHVYIAKEPMPVSFISLGKLQSTNGNQVYDITGMPSFTDYKYVSIHCVAYNHLFGYAEVK